MIKVELSQAASIEDRPVEIVERKGLGHPDTICDAVMDRVSQALCQTYLRECGHPLHHNCDKGLLVAGQAEHRFGGGRILAPMKLIFGDRATAQYGARRIDVGSIAVTAAKHWFDENLPRINPQQDLAYQVELHPGSEQLAAIFETGQAELGANDTSAAVGYAPLTETEQLVYAAERTLFAQDMRARFPELGDDVKIMGIRRQRCLQLIVAVPLLDTLLPSAAAYFERKRAIADELERRLASRLRSLDRVTVTLNALDSEPGTISSVYVTVNGLSAESADSGAVGRGNRVNGLIPLLRPRGAEAAAGKNPYSHVGKIYSVLTQKIAEELVASVEGVAEATVWMCSRIGAPISEPEQVSVEVRTAAGTVVTDVAPAIETHIGRRLAGIRTFCDELAGGLHPVC